MLDFSKRVGNLLAFGKMCYFFSQMQVGPSSFLNMLVLYVLFEFGLEILCVGIFSLKAIFIQSWDLSSLIGVLWEAFRVGGWVEVRVMSPDSSDPFQTLHHSLPTWCIKIVLLFCMTTPADSPFYEQNHEWRWHLECITTGSTRGRNWHPGWQSQKRARGCHF